MQYQDEQEWPESVQLMDKVLELAPGLVVYVDTAFRIRYLNQVFYRYFGEDARSWVGRRVEDIHVDAECSRRHVSYFSKTLAARRRLTFSDTMPVFKPGGEPMDVEMDCIPDIRGGQVVGIAVFMRDISEQLIQERALKASEEQFRSLFMHAAVGMGLLSLDGRYQMVNERLCQIIGRESDEIVGKSYLTLTHPDDYAKSRRMMHQLRHEGIPSAFYEKRYLRKDESIVWVRVSLGVLKDSKESPGQYLVIMEDLQERKKIEEALHRAEDQFKSLAEMVPIFIAMMDSIGRLTYVSPGWETFTGQSVESANGFGWLNVMHPEDRARIFNPTAMDPTPGKYMQFEHRYRRKDGQYRWFLVNSKPIFDENGSITAWFSTSMDIHDSYMLREELAKARDDAQAANQAKDHFLAVLSHELRTPLAPVLMELPMLQADPTLLAEMKESLAMVYRNVQLEARLIDDLLDLTRVSKGKMTLRREMIDPHLLLENVLRICQEEVAAKKIQIVCDFADTDVHIHGDPARLQQIFWNVIKNAIKFTPAGGEITVRSDLKTTSGFAEKPRICIKVIDTGIGLVQEQQERIFEPFFQVPSLPQQKSGGLGLGLPISRKLAELHEGTLTAQSDGLNKGTTFKLELPVVLVQVNGAADLEQTPVSAEYREAPAVSAESVVVLLVDDHEDTLQVMSKLLKKFGYEVISVTTKAEAIEMFKQWPVDLVLSDIGLPDGSGLDLLQELRIIQPEVLAIALSGYGMENDVQNALRAGFRSHVTKPVDAQQLLLVMRQVLKEHSSHQSLL